MLVRQAGTQGLESGAFTSCQLAASSLERQMPQWCWRHSTSGRAAQRSMRCGSWMLGSPAAGDPRGLPAAAGRLPVMAGDNAPQP